MTIQSTRSISTILHLTLTLSTTCLVSCSKPSSDSGNSDKYPRQIVSTQTICSTTTSTESTPNGQGSSWKTVDDYRFSASGSSWPAGITSTADGQVFVTGFGRPTDDIRTFGHWITRKSSNAGTSWTVVDEYGFSDGERVAPTFYAVPRALTITPSGTLVAMGPIEQDKLTEGGFAGAILRSSTDHGATWNTTEMPSGIVTGGVAAPVTPTSLIADALGSLFMLPLVTTSGATPYVVMKSTNLGRTWTTLESVPLSSTGQATTGRIVSDSAGNLYSIGSVLTQVVADSKWIVRKSTDHGVTWTVIDTYTPSGLAAGPSAIFFGATDATLYVAGSSSELTTTGKHWIVRKSVDSGASWSVVDDYYNSGNGGLPVPRAGIRGSDGKLYVFGSMRSYQTDSSGYTASIITRTSSDGGATWSNENLFAYVSGCQTLAGNEWAPYIVAVHRDTAGNLYVALDLADSTRVNFPSSNDFFHHWVVRMKPAGT